MTAPIRIFKRSMAMGNILSGESGLFVTSVMNKYRGVE